MTETEQIYKYIDLAADRSATEAVERYAAAHKHEERLQDVEQSSGKNHTHIGWIKLAVVGLFTAISTLAWMNFK